MARQRNTTRIEGFKGLDNINLPEHTEPNYLKEVSNVDVTNGGELRLRSGYELIQSGAWSSLWSTEDGEYGLVVSSDTLYRLNKGSGTLTTLATLEGLSDAPVSYAEYDGKIYFSNTHTNGVVTRATNAIGNWGIESYPGIASISNTTGQLEAGKYIVACTYVRSDGLEGGTSTFATITLSSDKSGIQISTTPSSDANVSLIQIYLSTVNGNELFRYKLVANASLTVYLAVPRNEDDGFERMNIFPAPKGRVVREYNGRMLVCVDKLLVYSKPFSPELFDLVEDGYQFSDSTVSCMPVEDGIYVAAGSRFYFLQGTNVEDLALVELDGLKIVPGSEQRISAHHLDPELGVSGYVWMFAADKGIFLAGQGGGLINLSSSHVELPLADSAAATLLRKNGLTQYIALLRNPQSGTQNVAASDIVVANVYKANQRRIYENMFITDSVTATIS